MCAEPNPGPIGGRKRNGDSAARQPQDSVPRGGRRASGVSARRSFSFIADVVMPLAVVSAIVVAGKEAVFVEGGSYLHTLVAGEVINLRRETGMHTMEVSVDGWRCVCVCGWTRAASRVSSGRHT